MGQYLRKHWYKVTMIAVSAVLLVAVAYVYWGGPKEEALPVIKSAAQFELTDLSDNAVSLENTKGKVRLLYFFFANCPDVCPPTTHMLSRVQDKLVEKGIFGSKAMILQATIDPERDTPDVLKKYAESYGADLDAWKFLRGTEQQVKEIAESYGISILKDDKGNFGHINAVVLIDENNQVRRNFTSKDLNEDTIAADVIKLAK